MSQIMKAFLGVFIVLFMTVSAGGILIAYLQVLSAQDIHARMIDEVENSHFYRGVLEECYDLGEEKGYAIAMTFYDENGGSIEANSKEAIPVNTDTVDSVKITLTFPYQIAFLNIDQAHILCGYAR